MFAKTIKMLLDSKTTLTGSAVLLLGLAIAIVLAALGFEHIGGYKPCPLCLLERKAWYVAIPAALTVLMALKFNRFQLAKLLLLAIALMFMVNAGLAGYHAGVEWKWWAGPTSCSGDQLAPLGGGPGGLLGALNNTTVIRCDIAQFRLFGISFSGYNFLMSLLASLLAFIGLVTSRRR
jgi:disulfide bond formation protein DsbB